MAKAHPMIDVRMATEFTVVRAGRRRRHRAGHATPPARARRSQAAIWSAPKARAASSRKDLDIEFEGFTYPDRTLNIEVAYDFRQHGYTERNYISDPDEWSNLFHWKGPPDRWRVHFPTDPRRRGRR